MQVACVTSIVSLAPRTHRQTDRQTKSEMSLIILSTHTLANAGVGNKSSPKSFGIGKTRVAIPHGREWNPAPAACILLSVQCPLQTSPITMNATSTPHRRTHDDGIYHASIASSDKNAQNSNLADIHSKKSSNTSYNAAPPK